MPLFTYICARDHEADHVFSVHEERPVVLACPKCRQPSQRLFKLHQLITMEPYVTTCGGETPTEIRTPSEERAFEKKYGLAHLMDSDIQRMRDGLSGQKERIRKRNRAALEPMAESYAKAEAHVNTMGSEHIKAEQAKEFHEMESALKGSNPADDIEC